MINFSEWSSRTLTALTNSPTIPECFANINISHFEEICKLNQISEKLGNHYTKLLTFNQQIDQTCDIVDSILEDHKIDDSSISNSNLVDCANSIASLCTTARLHPFKSFFLLNDRSRLKTSLDSVLSRIDPILFQSHFILVACKYGCYDVISFWLSNLCDLSSFSQIRDSNDSTVLHLASLSGNLPAFNLLLSKCSSLLSAFDLQGQTPLHLVCKKGDLAFVEAMLDSGAYQNDHQEEVVEILQSKDALIDAPNSHGQTPLYAACQNGHKEVVEVLLAGGANIDAPTNDGATPLYIAYLYEHEEVVKVLLAGGANHDGDLVR